MDIRAALATTEEITLIARLLGHYYAATEDTKAAGRNWYSDEREVCRQLAASYGLSLIKVAGVVAALSPQTRWETNIAGAIRLLRAWANGEYEAPANCTLYYKNATKAWRILTEQGDPTSIFGDGPKTIAFWNNLSGNENAVTVDTWMLRACGEEQCHTSGLKSRYYRRYVDVIRRAAELTGETPAQFQAIVWLQVRGG